MPKHARDPLAIAILLFTLLFVALMLYLLGAAMRERARDGAKARFVPPGWTEPTYPPPSKTPEKTP